MGATCRSLIDANIKGHVGVIIRKLYHVMKTDRVDQLKYEIIAVFVNSYACFREQDRVDLQKYWIIAVFVSSNAGFREHLWLFP